MATRLTHPIRTLREHATALEAALSVSLAENKPKTVHKLRTSTRRLQAQIRLLGSLEGMPEHAKQAGKVSKHLQKIRQEAGRVRDLDVQTEMLEAQLEPNSLSTDDVDSPSISNAEVSADQVSQQRESDLKQMIATRHKRRDEEAKKLTKLVEQRQAKIAGALEKLMSALEPVEGMTLPVPVLIGIAEKRFQKTPALRAEQKSEDDLHTIRKAAKQVRYLAETSSSRSAEDVAKRYENLQEAGGQWHDWLDLAGDAAKELGRKHAVSSEFASLRDDRLTAYRELLTDFVA